MTSYCRLKQTLFYALLLIFCSSAIQASSKTLKPLSPEELKAKKTSTTASATTPPTKQSPSSSQKKTSFKDAATQIQTTSALTNVAKRKTPSITSTTATTGELKTTKALLQEQRELYKEYANSEVKGEETVKEAYEKWNPLQKKAITDTEKFEKNSQGSVDGSAAPITRSRSLSKTNTVKGAKSTRSVKPNI